MVRRIVIGLLLLTVCASASAESPRERVIAVVPKFMNHPFFDYARLGCKEAEKELPGYTCLYIGTPNFDEEGQVKVIQDLIVRKVDGIAVAPLNAAAVGRALRKAQDAGIPVVTWDSDVLEQDRGTRRTYIGTHNYEIGVQLAKLLIARKPNGGTVAIQTGNVSAANLQERVQGVRDTLHGKHWEEVAGTPFHCNDDGATAVQQLADILTRYPKLDAFVAVGAWPQMAHQGYRAAIRPVHSRIEAGELVMIVADTLPVQLDLLREGLAAGLVGQRPFEMGKRSMFTLKDIIAGATPPDPIYTPLDICERASVDTCTKG